MKMKKEFVIAAAAVLSATIVCAAPTTKRSKSNSAVAARNRAAAMAEADAEELAGMTKRQVLFRNTLSRLELPKPGRNNSTAVAPSLPGVTFVQCNQKERRWILLEAKYANQVRQERLTFTWHVLLDMDTADKDVRGDWKSKDLPNPPNRYSYFTTQVSYENIPSDKTVSEHAASVCLAPSYLECFGEPVAIGIEVTNKDGELMNGGFGVEKSSIEDKYITAFTPRPSAPDKFNAEEFVKTKEYLQSAFWKNDDIMKNVTRREGLRDRSKTIWGLVKPNFFELVAE